MSMVAHHRAIGLSASPDRLSSQHRVVRRSMSLVQRAESCTPWSVRYAV